MMAIYDGLVEYHPKTMEPIPAIAESWEISPDSTIFTFHLRRNARWSNGERVTAQDQLLSAQLQLTSAQFDRTLDDQVDQADDRRFGRQVAQVLDILELAAALAFRWVQTVGPGTPLASRRVRSMGGAGRRTSACTS